MIIRDLYESNANQLISELHNKLHKLQSVANNTEPEGDFQQTVCAKIQLVKVALKAVQDEYSEICKQFPTEPIFKPKEVNNG